MVEYESRNTKYGTDSRGSVVWLSGKWRLIEFGISRI